MSADTSAEALICAELNRESVLGTYLVDQLLSHCLRLGSSTMSAEVERDGQKYEVLVRPVSLNPWHCMGTNCHAGTHDRSIAHSLQCQEEATYSYAGQQQPDELLCEKLIADRWKVGALPAADADGKIYGVPAKLLTDPVGINAALQDFVADLVCVAYRDGAHHSIERRVVAAAKRMGLIGPKLVQPAPEISEEDWT